MSPSTHYIAVSNLPKSIAARKGGYDWSSD